MKKTDNAISAGLAYMLAAQAAIPKTLGDRDRVSVMHSCMKIAVQNRFPFKPEDAEPLQKLNIHTCVGVFRALDQMYYRRACQVGGTYPRLWEAAANLTPWKAAVALFPQYIDMGSEVLENNRVTTDIGVLMPQSFGAAEPDLANHMGHQVWWVTNYSDETINLCRYKPTEGYAGHLRRPAGAPARRRQIDRAAWDKYQAEVKETWANRPNPDQRPEFVRNEPLAQAA